MQIALEKSARGEMLFEDAPLLDDEHPRREVLSISESDLRGE